MSDETAAKPIDAETREHATRLLLKVEQCFGHVELRVPRETALAMIAGVVRDAVESALAEAKAENEAMRANLESLQADLNQCHVDRDKWHDEADELYSEAPCPNCGATITGGCWGCLLKAEKEAHQRDLAASGKHIAKLIDETIAQAGRIAKLEKIIDDLVDPETEFPNDSPWLSELIVPVKLVADARAALASPSEPAGGRKGE